MVEPPTLVTQFAAAYSAEPGRPALVDRSGSAWTFPALDRWSATTGRRLHDAGCRPGDRVLVQAGASASWIALYLACLRTGLVLVPVSTDYGPAELQHFLADAAPRIAVADPAARAPLARACVGSDVAVLALTELTDAAGNSSGALPSAAAHDLAALLYSSGTTGLPKGARLTHANLLANAATLAREWGFSRQDRLLHSLPLHHAHGLFVALGTAWTSGATVLLRGRFDAADVTAALPGATVFMGVPTHYARLLREPGLAEAARGLRLCVSGSAPLPAETHRRFAALTGHSILERYGMTETLMLTSNPLVGERRPGSVGRPLPGVDVRLGDGTGRALPAGQAGEIEVRGPSVTSGYWRQPARSAEAFTPDGWFRTGDLGSMAADGYLTIVGRSKDLVISGGLNVYPREVELVLDALPDVAESAVVGVPHPDFGEAVVAAVVPRAGKELSPEAVQQAARAALAGYKAPKRIFVEAELPRNAMGKVQKNLLRDRYRGSFPAPGGERSRDAS